MKEFKSFDDVKKRVFDLLKSSSFCNCMIEDAPRRFFLGMYQGKKVFIHCDENENFCVLLGGTCIDTEGNIVPSTSPESVWE